MSLNVLKCKKDDKIDLSLTQKEAAFVLNVLSSLIQNDTEEPGHDYKSDDSDESTKQGYYIIPAPKSNDMVEGILNILYCTHFSCVHSESQK